MTQYFIDSITGKLRVTETNFVSKQTTPDELFYYFRNNNLSVRDIQNGWKHYAVHNAKLNENYFIFTFYFENDILKMVDFIVSDSFIDTSSWSDWSEKKELEKKNFYDNWLTTEIGRARKFSWGSIGAFYDSKGGSSSIVLKYQ